MVVITQTVPVPEMSYCCAAPADAGAGIVGEVAGAVSAVTGVVSATSVPGSASSSSVAARSPIALLSAALRMPMFAATAAVPASRTPAIAAAVRSDVRLVSERVDRCRGAFGGVEFMWSNVRLGVPAGGKPKANVG